jgi:hypothetical protein
MPAIIARCYYGPSWGVMKEALRRLIRIAENLVTLVVEKSKSFDEEQELFKKTRRCLLETGTVTAAAIASEKSRLGTERATW